MWHTAGTSLCAQTLSLQLKRVLPSQFYSCELINEISVTLMVKTLFWSKGEKVIIDLIEQRDFEQ